MQTVRKRPKVGHSDDSAVGGIKAPRNSRHLSYDQDETDDHSMPPAIALDEHIRLRLRPMASPDELSSFISSSFRSVWALELLLLLKGEATALSPQKLVAQMRSSSSVVEKALQELVAAGLAGIDGSTARYMPVTPAVAELVDETEELYASRPDRVRRLIVASSNRGLAAFSDAFRLKD